MQAIHYGRVLNNLCIHYCSVVRTACQDSALRLNIQDLHAQQICQHTRPWLSMAQLSQSGLTWWQWRPKLIGTKSNGTKQESIHPTMTTKLPHPYPIVQREFIEKVRVQVDSDQNYFRTRDWRWITPSNGRYCSLMQSVYAESFYVRPMAVWVPDK